ncbi:MAG: hypothetical protein HUU28_07120 [Planctomycetaceae bacterium]|nr:hypothetical protein [Planctomycetaceae bacterium]
MRHGHRFEGKSTWTQEHVLWIRGQRMDSEAQQRGGDEGAEPDGRGELWVGSAQDG